MKTLSGRAFGVSDATLFSGFSLKMNETLVPGTVADTIGAFEEAVR